MLGSVQYHLCFHISQVIFLCVPFTLPHSLLLSSPTHLPTYQRTNAPNRRHRRHRDRGGGGADLHRRPRLQLYQNALRTHRRRVRPARPVNTVTDTVTDAVTDAVTDTVTQYDVTPWLSHCIRHIRSACAPSAVPEPCRNAVWRERESGAGRTRFVAGLGEGLFLGLLRDLGWGRWGRGARTSLHTL